MPHICPTVTAYDVDEYRTQVSRVSGFAERVHIDLMDGKFAPTESPPLEQIWLPPHKTCDVHLMYQNPMDYLDQVIKLRPHMVVIHAEADVDHMHFAATLHKEDIKVGLALLQGTSVERVDTILHSFDHVLIFSGHLGHHGGVANLDLISKVHEVRREHPDAEIGWDGGINEHNAPVLIEAGVDVLNVGGYVQRAKDPVTAYATLKALAGRS